MVILVDLIMVDTRITGRDLQAGTSGATVTSTSRQLMGTTQFNWWKKTKWILQLHNGKY